MPAPTISRERVRLKVDVRKTAPIIDELTSQTPVIWKGTDTQFELALFAGDDLASVTNIATITVELKLNTDRQGPVLMTKSIGAGDLNTSLSLDHWTDGSDQHALLAFNNVETDLDITPGTIQVPLYCVISATTTDSPPHVLTLGIATVNLLDDGTPTESQGAPVVGGNLVPGDATYNNTGQYILSGLTADVLYVVTFGEDDTSLVNGGTPISLPGPFTAVETVVTLTGIAFSPVTTDVRVQAYLTQAEGDARYQMPWTISGLVTDIATAQSTANAAAAAATGAQSTANDAETLATSAGAAAAGASSDATAAATAAAAAQTTANAAIPLTQKGANSGVATLDSGGHIPTAQLPISAGPALSDANPINVQVGGSPAPGTGVTASRTDHVHVLPLATGSTPGAMSAADKTKLDALAGSVGVAVGFDGSVKSLLLADGALWVGGAFGHYGSQASAKIARLSLDGRFDPGFIPGSGFTQDVTVLARAIDGDVLAGTSTTVNTYKGVLGKLVWKINADGDADSFTCPDPICGGNGPEVLQAIDVGATGNIAMVTQNAFRITDPTGSSLELSAGTDRMSSVRTVPGTDNVLVSSWAYSNPAGPTGQTLDGNTNPKGLKLVCLTSAGGCGPGTLVDAFVTGAGDGANATCERIVIGADPVNGYYAIVGNRVDVGAIDHSWNANVGSNELSWHGFYKVFASGTIASDFDCTIVCNSGAPIPFGVDASGKVYFGGDIASINAHSVTAWRLYRLNADGSYDTTFDLFDDKVLACVLNGDTIIAAGDFTHYGSQNAGHIIFLTATGSTTPTASDPGSVLADNEGPMITQDTAPDVVANPRNRYKLWRTLTAPIAFKIWDFAAKAWTSVCSLCFQNEAPSTTQVNDPVFSPVAGTAIGGGLSVVISVPQFSTATIYYTTDGSDPKTSGTRTLYSAPIAVSVTTTIKAFASKNLYLDSNIVTAPYATGALTQLAVPTFSPVPSTTTVTPLTVTITPSTSGAAVYYSLDPLADLSTFTAAAPDAVVSLNLVGNNVVRAFCLKAGSLNSEVATASYNSAIQIAKVGFVWRIADNYSGAVLIMGTWNIPDLTIRYNLGNTPQRDATPNSRVYTGPVSIPFGGQWYVTAYATSPGYLDSDQSSSSAYFIETRANQSA